MILTKQDYIKLNHFARGAGEEALEYLAERLYEYYANEVVLAQGNEIFINQGAARLTKWLKTLPKGLRDASNVQSVAADTR